MTETSSGLTIVVIDLFGIFNLFLFFFKFFFFRISLPRFRHSISTFALLTDVYLLSYLIFFANASFLTLPSIQFFFCRVLHLAKRAHFFVSSLLYDLLHLSTFYLVNHQCPRFTVVFIGYDFYFFTEFLGRLFCGYRKVQLRSFFFF